MHHRSRQRPSLADIERQQRARILDATLSIASVAGYAELSIASILAVADVRRRTFNALFTGKEDAFLAVCRQLIAQFVDQLTGAYEGDATPAERVAACLSAAVDFVRADPVRAEIVLIEVHAAGTRAVGLQQAALATIVDRTEVVLTEAGVDGGVPVRLAAELAVGAVHDALRASLARGELDALAGRIPDLTRAAFPMLMDESLRAAPG